MKRICKGCVYWDGESCLNEEMSDEYWEGLITGMRDACEFKTMRRQVKRH